MLLCYIKLYCILLYYIIFNIILYYIILCYIILYSIMFYISIIYTLWGLPASSSVSHRVGCAVLVGWIASY